MKIKRACVISGGGSWGAFGGGTLARLNRDYNIVVGISTGSLLAPLVALKEWELLETAHTSLTDDNIFDKCWCKGKPINKSGGIKILPIVVSLIMGHKSICSSNILRKTIDEIFTIKHFKKLKEQNKEILVGTQNFAQIPSKIHYFSSINEEFEEFKDWMWCSANFPFFTSLIKKSWSDDFGKFHVGLWSDGGLTELIGLDQLMGKGYNEIDIILHRRKNINNFEGKKITNLMENIMTNINAMRYDIEFEFFYDKIKKLNSEGVRVNVYWLPRKLNNNWMVFNKEEMTSWWNEGYETALDSNRVEVFEPIKRVF